MSRRAETNRDLQHAFPAGLRNDVLGALSTLPYDPRGASRFAVTVNGEAVSIPTRIYHDTTLIHVDKLNSLQRHLLDGLLTRHHDGFTRQKHLARVAGLPYPWGPPFVVQLLGEYVIDIIRVIEDNLGNLDAPLYASFLRANPLFLALTEQRVSSYWDCYFRSHSRDQYVGFRVLRFFKGLVEGRS